MGVNRGPIKATRQAIMKKEDSQRSLGNNGKLAALQRGPSQASQDDQVGLYIDSRKPKRPLGSESYKIDGQNGDLNDFMNNY